MLNALRSTIFFVSMAVLVVPWAIVALLISLFVKPDTMYWVCVGYLRCCIWGARHICGVRHVVHGSQHLPSADPLAPVILCSKHQSAWETLAFPTLMSHPLAYVFKRELLRIPFFGWAMGRMDMIHIDRSNRVEAWTKVAAQGKRLLGRGVWVIMFPEGTRSARGGQGTYKAGATRLALTVGVPVVPIAVNSARCWPRKSLVLRPGVVDISIGPPISSAGREPDEMMREVEQWIEAEMRRIDPPAYAVSSSASSASAAVDGHAAPPGR
jgi:1-acyl-sn-glycerol-3-phosphate acyltransferase